MLGVGVGLNDGSSPDQSHRGFPPTWIMLSTTTPIIGELKFLVAIRVGMFKTDSASSDEPSSFPFWLAKPRMKPLPPNRFSWTGVCTERASRRTNKGSRRGGVGGGGVGGFGDNIPVIRSIIEGIDITIRDCYNGGLFFSSSDEDTRMFIQQINTVWSYKLPLAKGNLIPQILYKLGNVTCWKYKLGSITS